MSLAKTSALTALAMLAFAANSVLCRMALGGGHIDPASFAAVRVLSGALTLAAIALATRRGVRPAAGQWPAALMLFSYLIFFAFAYVTLGAGVGALILFGAVQLTMLGYSLAKGARLNSAAWAGLAAAIGGLVYLVWPGLTAPPAAAALAMALAGVSWGVYSLLGRGGGDPLSATTANFILAAPLTLLVAIAAFWQFEMTATGAALAVASGSIASGLGYVVWYAALRGLTTDRAAVVQLSVPALAALGGVGLLGEPLSARLILASVVTLGGIGVVLTQRRQ